MQQIFNLLLTVALFMQKVETAALPGFNECMFNGHFYEIGESFHPVIEVLGREYEAVCYNCTCQPTTIAQCVEVTCPLTDCDHPVQLEGQCCHVCVEPEILPGPKQCIYEGLSIPHGEQFHPPSMVETFENEMNKNTSMKDLSLNPFCIQCLCTDGDVQCTDVSVKCPPLFCSDTQAFLAEGNCCMECPTPPPITSPKPKRCRDFDGTSYTDGETWNPFYPGYGRVECINCTCSDGKTTCFKEPCPDVPYCEPGEPIPEEVICCFKCTPRTVTTTVAPQVSSDLGTDVSPDITDITPSADSVSPVLVPCETKDYIINVFKHLINDTVAIENEKLNTVDIYSWAPTESGDLMKNVVSVDSVNFRGIEDFQHFQFVGKTLLRRVNGLSTRETRRDKIRMCTQNCSSLVVRFLRPVINLECTMDN